jgi:alkaline phosphatase D
MKKSIFTLLALLFTAANAQNISQKHISKIAFGSCNGQNNPQLIWNEIIKDKPELFIFLGDNIYGDTKDMSLLKQKYDLLGSKEGYRKLKENTKVIATWDDHDYGVNDGGKEYSKKEESKKIFLDFFDESQNSERRSRPGIYTSYYYEQNGKKLQIIVLDTRTFRDKLRLARIPNSCKGEYAKCLSKRKTMLGDAQWAWLEEELKKSADLRLIASSTQFLVDFNGWEAWINMPHERERFLKLIERTKANGVFFISGDVHYSEYSKWKRDSLYPIYDFTSSGLTHGHSCAGGNKHRIYEPFMKANYGLITINWDADKPSFTSEIKDESGKTQIAHSVLFSEIKF